MSECKVTPVDPFIEDWPHTTCFQCGRSKINGLFAPFQLRKDNPVCMLCSGTLGFAGGAKTTLLDLLKKKARL